LAKAISNALHTLLATDHTGLTKAVPMIYKGEEEDRPKCRPRDPAAYPYMTYCCKVFVRIHTPLYARKISSLASAVPEI